MFLIWALENNPTLSKAVRDAIIEGENMVYVSAASIWEISINKALGKLETPDNLLEELAAHRFAPLSIHHEHAILAGSLPDPFDRMMVAQSIIEKLCLVTRDGLISRYDVKILGA